MFNLIWTIALIAAQGPVIQDVPHAYQKFENKAQCEQYGEAHQQRMQDWVRGAIRVPLEFPVSVVGRCAAEERGA
jgi:hypothetical protein